MVKLNKILYQIMDENQKFPVSPERRQEIIDFYFTKSHFVNSYLNFRIPNETIYSNSDKVEWIEHTNRLVRLNITKVCFY